MFSRRKNPITFVAATAGFLFVLGTSGWAEEKKKGRDTVISDGKQVSLEYTVTLEDKTKVDSNVGKDPLVYTHGTHSIIPGLEKQLAGLKVGDTKRVEVSPEEGYGPVHPELKQEIEKTKLPPEAQKVGVMLEGRSPDGRAMFARVTEIKDKTVVLDLNHPLAGKKLIFDVKVLKIEEGKEKKVEAPTPSTSPQAKPAK